MHVLEPQESSTFNHNYSRSIVHFKVSRYYAGSWTKNAALYLHVLVAQNEFETFN